MYIILKKEVAIYKIQRDSCQKPDRLRKSSKEVHFSRSDTFLLFFVRKFFWQKYCLLMQRENGFVEFHHFIKKGSLNNSSKKFLKQWKPMGFCKLQTKKCEEISTTRLRHVNYLHSSSIYPHESKNKTEKGRKSKVKIIATITSQLKLVGLAHSLKNKGRKVAGIFRRVRRVS